MKDKEYKAIIIADKEQLIRSGIFSLKTYDEVVVTKLNDSDIKKDNLYTCYNLIIPGNFIKIIEE